MEREKTRKIGMAACVLVMLLGVIALAVYIGFGDDFEKALEKNDESTSESSAFSEPESVAVSSPEGQLNAVWLEYGFDCKTAEEASAALSQIKSWNFNAVILSGFPCGELKDIVASAAANGLYAVVNVAQGELVSGGIANEQFAAQLANTNAQSVMVEADAGLSKREMQVAAKAVRSAAPSVYLGVYAASQVNYIAVADAGLFDYKYIDIVTPGSAVNGDYAEYLGSYLDGITADTFFGIHTELIGNTPGFEKPEEIMNQLEAVSRTASNGFGIYRYSVFKENKNGIADAVMEYMSTGIMKDFFKELVFSKPAKTSFETNESKVSFVGTADVSQPLKFNGHAVDMIEDGYFAFDAGLNIGKNTFVFEHKDKTVKYEITYKPELIKAVEPAGTMKAPGGACLDISVLALDYADVSVTISGINVPLSRSDSYGGDRVLDAGSDYTYYIGSYILPESTDAEQNLGHIKVTASCEGQKQSVNGATVIVNAAEKQEPIVTEPLPQETSMPVSEENSDSVQPDSSEASTQDGSETETTATTKTEPATQGSSKEIFDQLSPYEYNGVSGKSKMVIVNGQFAETFPPNTTNDINYPYYTPLPEGTVDYVTGTVSYDGKSYYVLRSGRRVYQKEVKYIASGYNMPSNEIRTIGVEKKSTATEITFSLKWKVPFNVRENPQSFYSQTPGTPYSITSYTVEYVDIVFYYTGAVDAAPQFSSNVISRAVWLDSDGDTQTLRLFLKKRGGFYGIKYFYNSDGTLTFSIKERTSSSISGKVVMLDAGHGGQDPGAIGAVVVGSKNVYEATINLSIANKMKAKLEALGATVLMTRTSSGQTLSLDERVSLCRKANPDIYVAVHCDASESSSPSGTTAYYYKSYAFLLAKYIGEGVVGAYKNTVYANNSAMASVVDKGTGVFAFRVTRVEECPSVLIEFGFVTNVVECKALTVDSNQDAIAKGAVDGIVKYFKNS